MGDVFIPPDSQKRLLQLARQTLEDFVRGAERHVQEISDPSLQSCDYGAFVSLHNQQTLRGCVGNCAPNARLFEVVIEMTEAAASRDGRMAPVSADELDDIRIDITVLSPLERVDDPLALQVGKHGLHIAQGAKRGVLLPQVAAQYEWDMKTFVEQTCVKAGLRKDAWKDPRTEISSFTGLIIEEQP
jgi:AmmeMemoRadiSam system protein A